MAAPEVLQTIKQAGIVTYTHLKKEEKSELTSPFRILGHLFGS